MNIDIPCGAGAPIEQVLADKYHEHRAAAGIGPGGKMVVELTRTADGATWTILALMPDGTACLLSAGKSWTMAP